jgi:hypothetical protein
MWGEVQDREGSPALTRGRRIRPGLAFTLPRAVACPGPWHTQAAALVPAFLCRHALARDRASRYEFTLTRPPPCPPHAKRVTEVYDNSPRPLKIWSRAVQYRRGILCFEGRGSQDRDYAHCAAVATDWPLAGRPTLELPPPTARTTRTQVCKQALAGTNCAGCTFQLCTLPVFRF